jgi:hypothetical protein
LGKKVTLSVFCGLFDECVLQQGREDLFDEYVLWQGCEDLFYEECVLQQGHEDPFYEPLLLVYAGMFVDF